MKSRRAYLTLLVVVSLVTWACSANSEDEFDSSEWKAWPALNDPYDATRLRMVPEIKHRFGDSSDVEIVQALGPPDLDVVPQGPSPCEKRNQCSVLHWELGYEDGPIRLDPLVMFVVVVAGQIEEIGVSTR